MKYLNKKSIVTLLFAFILLHTFDSFAQSRWRRIEVGALLGASSYNGDVMEDRPDLMIEEMSFAGGLFVRLNYNSRIAFRAGVNYGRIKGADARNAGNDQWRLRRNLSFKSDIFEFSLLTEINIAPYRPGSKKSKFSPYILAGINMFHFNPKALYDGVWYELQPLGTEGQGTNSGSLPYSLNQISLAYGIGAKYYIGKNWHIAFEIAPRLTFTDYLDDLSDSYGDFSKMSEMAIKLSDRSSEMGNEFKNVSLKGRGNPERNDMYVFAGLIISKEFGRSRCLYY